MASDPVDVIGDLRGELWNAIDDAGIKGRLYLDDVDYIVRLFVERTRSQSPEWVAELIGGETKWASAERGYLDSVMEWGDRKDAEYDATNIRENGLEGIVAARVVGPWVETD